MTTTVPVVDLGGAASTVRSAGQLEPELRQARGHGAVDDVAADLHPDPADDRGVDDLVDADVLAVPLGQTARDAGRLGGGQVRRRDDRRDYRQDTRDWRRYSRYDYNRFEPGYRNYDPARYYRDGQFYRPRALTPNGPTLQVASMTMGQVSCQKCSLRSPKRGRAG